MPKVGDWFLNYDQGTRWRVKRIDYIGERWLITVVWDDCRSEVTVELDRLCEQAVPETQMAKLLYA